MHSIEFTIKNYRCFPEFEAARFSLRPGFTSFVGPNNSGKSTLLRFFFEFRSLFQYLANASRFADISLKGVTFDFHAPVPDPMAVFSNRTNRDIEITISLAGQDLSFAPEELGPLTISIPRRGPVRARLEMPVPLDDGRNLSIDGTTLRLANYQTDFRSWIETFEALTNTLYVGAFRNVVNLGGVEQYYDIDVGNQFIGKWHELKSGPVIASNEAIWRLTEDIRGIFGFRTLEINAVPGGSDLQVLIDGRSYRLGELGSGMAHFLLVLANVATKKPDLLLIDEPELNLHPSLQLDFLTTISSYAKQGCAFASHSLGLARASSERIYSVQLIDQGRSRITAYEETPNLPEFLGLLSLPGYRDLGFDGVLLVEGPSEVRTIHQFLRFYAKEHRVVLLPLGGSSLIRPGVEHELDEAKRLGDNVLCLIDSERSSPNEEISREREGFVRACTNVGIRCHVLQRRAIENYFPTGAIQEIKGPKYAALSPFERLTDAVLPWSKADNWRIARAMTISDLRDTDLGEFLATL